jgi:hypothetical protein
MNSLSFECPILAAGNLGSGSVTCTKQISGELSGFFPGKLLARPRKRSVLSLLLY